MASLIRTDVLRPVGEARAALLERIGRLQQLQLSPKHLERLDLLSAKLQDGACVVAFCGHFSAGKSTLLNHLAGARVLPSSPIPTSANRVIIRGGEPGATVHFHNKGALTLLAGELDRLGELCADGDQVEAVEIRHPLAHVPEGVWLMDTPGIDSTDDAHRVATESALYLADAIFYVMDYNHVQSEINFQFTRSLVEWGKPLFLVVNQIDKHVELELPSELFRQSVVDAFAGWGVHPEGVFFTSMREMDHPHSQWPLLLEAMERLAANREPLLVSGVWQSARRLMQEEERLREQEQSPERERLQQALECTGESPSLRLAMVEAELKRLERLPQQVTQQFLREASALLANAPLFPYTTKELVDRYLESRRPGFRTGLFFAAQKTREEIERRLAALHADLAEKVKAHMEWHLQELLLKYGEQHGGRRDEAFEAEVRALTIPFEPALLADLVKTGSLVAKEYTPQYMKDVAAEIQGRFRRALMPLAERLADLVRARCRREMEPLLEERERLTAAVQAEARLAEMAAEAGAFRQIWSGALGEMPVERPQLRASGCAEPAARLQNQAAAPSHSAGHPLPAPAQSDALQGTTRGPQLSSLTCCRPSTGPAPQAIRGAELRRSAAERLRRAARLLAPLPGMGRTAADLQARAERLEQSRFTVALFGAFSAGKSSFANALMGAHVLPVSPNPTTAATSRILPPEPGRPHGCVHVTWKKPETLKQEVERSLAALQLTPSGDLPADLAAGARQSREATAPSMKPHAAFLAAAARGYDTVQDVLGTEEIVGLEQFASLVADEQRSCFVEEVALYVDCPLTRQGITLVDTPGVDSINARHTNVAFEYIKNADAILFVTYYNHAFSRADREFLMQLGRVKDAFALDKMFFLVNAADLAASQEELEQVVSHVRKNLQACGIRQARIFPISSQTALWSRLYGAGALPQDLTQKLQRRLGTASLSADLAAQGLTASGFDRFEEEFYRFVITDLSQMAIDAAFAEVARAAQTVAHWLEAARADESDRARRLAELQKAAVASEALIDSFDAEPEAHQLEREIDELLYYVKKRVLERCRDGFVEAFNPAALRSDSPDLKGALRSALHELLEFVAFDLAQEMRATALRVENALNYQAGRAAERAAAALRVHLPDWEGQPYEPVHPPVPTFSDGREHLSPAPFQPLLGLFRSPECFFTRGGRGQLLEELIKALDTPVEAYLATAREILWNWYGSAFAQRVERLKAEIRSDVQDHLRGLTAALTAAGESDKLAAALAQLQELAGPAAS